MDEWKYPKFDRTTKTWYVRKVDTQTGRVLSEYDFYDEEEALNFFIQEDVRQYHIRDF